MKKYRLKVGLDYDDTLAECNPYALKIINEKKGTNYKVEEITSWDGAYPALKERLELYSDPNFVEKQPLKEDAKKFVAELSKIADVYITTAVGLGCMAARAKRVKEDFPEIPEDRIIMGSSKELYNLDIILDDSPTNIIKSAATYPVLLRQPWNKKYSGMLSVNTYDDFLHLVDLIRRSYVEEPDLSKGGVICLIGPSGAGKTAIMQELIKDNQFVKPITTTTRAKRPNEMDNAYHFINEEEFIKAKENDKFLETTVYSGYHYGTSAKEINDIVDVGKYAVIPIDICGGITIKNAYRKKALLVFVNRKKSHVISEILSRDCSIEEKTTRIMSLDDEYENEALCDETVDNNGTLETSAAIVRNFLGL